jgi:hypothetical protein
MVGRCDLNGLLIDLRLQAEADTTTILWHHVWKIAEAKTPENASKLM